MQRESRFRKQLPSAAAFIAVAAGLSLAWSSAHAQSVLLTAPVTIQPGDTTITATAPGSPPVPLATADITVRGTTLTMNGRYTIRSLEVQSGGVVTHDAGFTFDYSGGAGTDVVNGMWLNVQANPVGTGGTVNVESGGRIDASERGFGRGSGPGAGRYCAFIQERRGASHGGEGSGNCVTPSPTYGSATSPALLGSGGNDGPGGGAIRLDVRGIIRNDGLIAASGVNGGAGGSVWILAAETQGNGIFEARGAARGGGGRVAICTGTSQFTGLTRSSADSGAAAGTVWLANLANTQGTLIVDGNGDSQVETPLLNGTLAVDTAVSLLATRSARVRADTPLSLESLRVDSNAVLSHPANVTAGLDMSVRSDVLILPTGRIDVSGRGFLAQTGPGAGRYCSFTQSVRGGAHGGAGGGNCGSPQSPNGSAVFPVSLGSGGVQWEGPAGGGGLVRLRAGGDVVVDGDLLADGTSELAGGAGGSIQIFARSISGGGLISASGAFGRDGGGGGGRIALYSCSLGVSNIRVSGGSSNPPLRAGGGGSFYSGPNAMFVQSQPLSRALCSGPVISFTYDVLGATGFSWTKNGQPVVNGTTPSGSVISGSTTGVLTITGATAADAGEYRAIATSACGSLNSSPANLLNCRGDFNCNNSVDFFDYLDFVAAFSAENESADFNDNGTVDFFDYLDFAEAFASAC